MSIKAMVAHLKTLSDGTQRVFLRLEGLGNPMVHSLSIYDGEIVLAEPVDPVAPTAQIPAIRLLEVSPSLYAPPVESGLN